MGTSLPKEYILPKLPEIDEDDDNEEAELYTEAMNKYLEYWEATWLGKVNKRTGQRGRPKFSFDLWVKYE